MTGWLLVGVGGFCGAVLRYLLSALVQRWTGDAFPAGTLVVNAAGCFALGLLMVLLERQMTSEATRLWLGVGLLGALTTFSTFGYETVALARRGAVGLAAVSIGGNVVLGLAAVLLGMAAARCVVS